MPPKTGGRHRRAMTNQNTTSTLPSGLTPASAGMQPTYRRSPVFVLVDTSGSMSGEKIDGVNDGWDLLVQELSSDPIAEDTVILNTISFGETVQSTGFKPVGETSPVRRVAAGRTPLGAALRLAARDLASSSRSGDQEQKGDYAAHGWILSDGIPTDEWIDAADALRTNDSVGMLNAIAIGDNADTGVLSQVVGGKGQVLRLEDVSPESIRKLFVWVSQVSMMATKSRQFGTTPTAVPFPAGLIPTV